MKKPMLILAAVAAMAFAGTAAAALVPGVYDPGNTDCPLATYASGILHLEKNCATATNAAAGADITGLDGQTFVTATFTLASAAQCQGGSPRFDIVTTATTFFLGCNNVLPTTNGDGTLTYVFDAATIAAGGAQVPFPTGTITGADVLLDVEGTADVSKIEVNGVVQVPTTTTGGGPTKKADCKKGGWKAFTNPSFKNQGRCIAYFNHHRSDAKHAGASAGKKGGDAGKTSKPGRKLESSSKGKHKK